MRFLVANFLPSSVIILYHVALLYIIWNMAERQRSFQPLVSSLENIFLRSYIHFLVLIHYSRTLVTWRRLLSTRNACVHEAPYIIARWNARRQAARFSPRRGGSSSFNAPSADNGVVLRETLYRVLCFAVTETAEAILPASLRSHSTYICTPILTFKSIQALAYFWQGVS